MIKYVIIIQCDIAHSRCSGFACTNDFYNKNGKFDIYDKYTKYISFTCGGCCGKSVAAKLEHFYRKLIKETGLKKNEVAVHLSSCITTDNYHYDRCPHIEYIKDIVKKKGFNTIIEGTFISKNASKKRENGLYSYYK